MQDNDQLGNLTWYASDGNSWEQAAIIQAKIDGTPGDGDLPTEMLFGVSEDGNALPTIRMTMAPAGTISGDFNDTSDVALKENIIDLENATEKLKQLKAKCDCALSSIINIFLPIFLPNNFPALTVVIFRIFFGSMRF